MDEQLQNYIRDMRQRGIADPQIRESLLNAGWPQSDVDQALGVPQQNPASDSVVLKSEPFAQPKSSLKTVLLSVIIIILLGAAGYFAYGKFKNSPEKVWEAFNSQQPLLSSRSGHSQETFKLSGNTSDGQDFQGELKAVSDSDVSDKDHPLSASKLSLSITIQGRTFQVEGVEVRTIGKILYANVSKIPGMDSLAKNYDGWVKIYSSSGQPEKSSGANFDSLRNSFTGTKFVKSHSYINKEQLNGKSVYHYSVEVDKNAVRKALGDYIDNLAKGASDAQSVQQTKETIAKVLDNLNIKNIGIWIGVDDKRLYATQASLDYTDNNGMFRIGAIQMSYTGLYSNYGAKIIVSPPAKALDLIEDKKLNPATPKTNPK